VRRHLAGTETGRIDHVTAVIIPIDGATRMPVRQGVDVQLWDQQRHETSPVRLVRNLSGHWILLNASADQDLTFRIVTDRGRYRGPVLVTFNPTTQGRPDHVVALERRPEASFDDVATLVRGVVVRREPPVTGETVPQEGVRVSASGGGLRGHQFPATTDDRGSFSLIVNVRRPGPDDVPPGPVRLRFEKQGVPTRDVEVHIEHGTTHVFSAPVDLDETGPIRFSHE
jgi:hypothetical protein